VVGVAYSRGELRANPEQDLSSSKLEKHLIAAAIADAAGIGTGLLAHADGYIVDEAITCRHVAAGHGRAIRPIICSLADIVATARGLAVTAPTPEASAIVRTAVHGLAGLERLLQVITHLRKVAGCRIHRQTREKRFDRAGTFRWISSDLLVALRVAIGAPTKIAIERLELVARIRTGLGRIRGARATAAAAAATAAAARATGTAAAADFAATRSAENRAHRDDK
jgi:hypothetical protein